MRDRKGVADLLAAGLCLLITCTLILPNSRRLTEGVHRFIDTRQQLPPIGAEDPSVSPTPETDTTAPVQEPSSDPPSAADLASTPADVLQAQAEMREKTGTLTPAGTVKESDMHSAGATDTVGNIRIKNTTSLHPDLRQLLEEGPVLDPADRSAPAVLIFHTHTSESYLTLDNGYFYKEYPTRTQDPEQGVVRVGSEICTALEARGIGCIHDTAVYDESYNGAYARSRIGIEKILAQYPTIRIVLDVHRDAFFYDEDVMGKPAARIGGKKAAQIMIISGAEDSGITGFPDWEDNLRFALRLQEYAEAAAPGLMRPLYFCPRKYNMDICPCSLLLEIGSDANTLEEAIYAGRLLAAALADLIDDA